MTVKTIKKLQQLDELLKRNATGNAKELSYKLGVSRKHVYNYINTLKDLGVDIKYSRIKRSFFYCEPYEITFDIKIKKLTTNEMINIFGGNQQKNNNKSVMKV